MKILDQFELEGGIAIEGYSEICRNLELGDILFGKPCTEGIVFLKDENTLGYITGDSALLAVYAYNNGYDIIARVTAIRRVEAVPTVFASLEAVQRGIKWGYNKEKV